MCTHTQHTRTYNKTITSVVNDLHTLNLAKNNRRTMGILSSILRVLPGFVTTPPKPNTTPTPLLQVTDTDATATTSHAAASTSAAANDTTTSASSASSSSTSGQEMTDYNMEAATTAATRTADAGMSLARIVSPFVHKTPHSTTAKTMHSTHLASQQDGTTSKVLTTVVAVSGGLPSNKRQESDLTTPNIESTVLSMDLDKDSRTTTTNSHEGGAKNTSITTENGVMMVYNTNNNKTAPSSEKEEAKYPLVQNRMFDVPEIIRSVAEFLDKPSLAKCCRVSKFWSTHCTPLLWRHIVDKHWRFGRFCSSIQSQSHYIRSIKCEDWTDYEEMLLCQFPRLKGIAFHGSKESMAVREKILAKVSNTLMSLVLSSVASELSADSSKAIQIMHQLTTLKIINMTVNQHHLADILRQCENLDFLSLSRVHLDNSAAMPAHGAVVGGESGPGLVVARKPDLEVVPTRIKYLAMKEVTVSAEYLTGMIRNCPNLLELSFARNETLVITSEMIRVMQKSCPRLYAIDIGSCKQLERETFTPLFTTLTQMTILNLSGTRVGDEDLLILAQKCRSLIRLDIQYCTQISSKGLHRFLSRCSSTLRHLEASGVTIEPESFDGRAWTCSNLEIMFVHVGLIGSYEPYIPSTAKARAAEAGTNEQQSQEDIESKKRSLPIEVVNKVDTPVSLLTRMLTGVTTATMSVSTPTSTSTSTSTSTTTATSTATSTDHHGQRHCRTAGSNSSASANIHTSASTGCSISPSNIKSSKEAGIGSRSATKSSVSRPGREQDGDVDMKHALHPIQDVSNVQYLGLMGCGPKLNRHTPCPLLSGFRTIKRLHVLGLYQSFKQEDLEWLVESLPELCRIDAEKYNISDEILGWFHSTYPHVRIYRQE
ncbi:hypothetical protein KI688_002886 [Linnemannia hyalina]|uniref:F-box domain-containing protein n=1 Tax=Linnemannia hyalina TaxID=64524 RepID=A0A9P8BQW6_9FUNG|nr:hypothetical protein KI688_002886 [Linnemannia hyalina]